MHNKAMERKLRNGDAAENLREGFRVQRRQPRAFPAEGELYEDDA